MLLCLAYACVSRSLPLFGSAPLTLPRATDQVTWDAKNAPKLAAHSLPYNANSRHAHTHTHIAVDADADTPTQVKKYYRYAAP